MLVLRAVARPMLASIFIVQGWDTFRNPERVAPRAEPVVRLISDRVPAAPGDTQQAVRLNGAIQVAAGTLLALGRFPRLAALALAATLVPTTAAGHRFWESEDKQERAQQRIHFLKNLTMLGGLLIAAGDTAGKPSLAWRTRNAARSTRREAAVATRAAKVSGKAGQASGQARATVSGKAAKMSGKAAKMSGKAAKASGKVPGTAAKISGKAAKASGKVPGTAAKMSAKMTGTAARMSAKMSGKAAKASGKAAKMSGKAGQASGKARAAMARARERLPVG